MEHQAEDNLFPMMAESSLNHIPAGIQVETKEAGGQHDETARLHVELKRSEADKGISLIANRDSFED